MVATGAVAHYAQVRRSGRPRGWTATLAKHDIYMSTSKFV
jgi:hypothetical protein